MLMQRSEGGQAGLPALARAGLGTWFVAEQCGRSLRCPWCEVGQVLSLAALSLSGWRADKSGAEHPQAAEGTRQSFKLFQSFPK